MVVSLFDCCISKDYCGFQIFNVSMSLEQQERRSLFGIFTCVEDDAIEIEVYVLFYGFIFGVRRS